MPKSRSSKRKKTSERKKQPSSSSIKPGRPAQKATKPKYPGTLQFHILQNLKTAQEFRIEKGMNESFLSKLFGNMR
ncbi:MAG: hypothetical protein ACP5NX_01970 [Candidatus Bilamarchaeaceae archaeon]